ncbi:MAG: RNA methyltransferase [Muribaculaceae bacterium]|nr:RNA methyltransferase [Muribaculaceae bacterium]
MQLTNAQRKAFASLSTAKGRRQTGLFMAQGEKCVRDTIDHFELVALVCEQDEAVRWADMPQLVTAKREDMLKISTLTTPPGVVAVYRIPEPQAKTPDQTALSLALDCVQDPGNLGTIMRVADWMGVRDIFASEDTADVWNPKVVQATMGAISRVKVHYCDLPSVLGQCGLPVYGTFLDGENIYKSALSAHGVIVMGNEGRGISPEVSACVTHRLLIPSYPPGEPTSESLNVAVATAITLSEFRRNG